MNLYKKARIQYVRTFYKCKICNLCDNFEWSANYCSECLLMGKVRWTADKNKMRRILHLLCPYYINAIKYWVKCYMLFYKIRIKMLWKQN